MIVVALLGTGLSGAAQTKNCIAHQPANARFTPPTALTLQWDCVTGGPLYGHEREWFIVTFKVTNTGQKRTEALKLQANLVDSFGGILETVPIVESARLGKGDSDGAVWAFHPAVGDKNSVDHTAFYVLGVKYADGTIWTAPPPQPQVGSNSTPRGLRRLSIKWDTYDMSSEIVPSPSPFPSRSPD